MGKTAPHKKRSSDDHVKSRMVPVFLGDSREAKPNFSLLIWNYRARCCHG